jgi:hypothetical protein
MAARSTGIADLMFKTFSKYISEVRRLRADFKNSGGSLNYAMMLDDAEKERSRLRENPPPCGLLIRYAQEHGYEETHGEFIFRTADVEQELNNMLCENPHLANGDEGVILNWVQGRDELLTEPTDVPPIWSRFRYVANNLVRAGKAQIYCNICKTAVGPDQITTNDDRGKRGWNFDRVLCQQGHNLLVIESVHLAIK